MYLDRNLVAKLLETKPQNIKSLQRVESKIHIQLHDLEDELFMTVEQYQTCCQQLKGNLGQIDRSSFVTIIAIISTFIFATMSSIDAKLANQTNSQTNIESVAEK